MGFLQREVILRDLQINELTISVSDMKGKFIKPTLKKVSKYENKFAKLQKRPPSLHSLTNSRLRTSRSSWLTLKKKTYRPQLLSPTANRCRPPNRPPPDLPTGRTPA